ncbi:MAG: M1 family metallopeptidase [Anaerolineae bacterium]
MRMQVFKAYTKVLVFIFLVGCGGAEGENRSPTPIAATAVSPAATPTSAMMETPVPPTPAPSTPVPTPTPAATAESAEAIDLPTLTPVPPIDVGNGRSIGDPYSPELGNTGYDVQHYTLQMALDPSVTWVAATVTIEVIATAERSAISLDFIGYAVQQLQVDGVHADFQRDEDKLLIALPQPVTAGSPFTIVVSYEGAPVEEPSPYISFDAAVGMRFRDGETIYVLSEPDGSRYWFPNNDHPRDKATFRFEVTVPEGLAAVANGILLDIRDNEPLPDGSAGETYVWEHNFPMATYLATIAVGEYERVDDVSSDGIPIRHYIFPEYADDFAQAASITGDAIDWMSDLFGPYPFETIGFVTADAPGASLETQTMVILSTNMIGQTTVVHELAHMWFGNWVSLNSWQQMWRNEGFATYVTLMWEHRDDPEGLELEIEAIKSAVSENDRQYPLGSPPPQYLFGFNTYFGSAVLVHELRRTVGDDAFFAGLQAYFEQYGGSTAGDAEFQAVMEAASGMSLDAFFAEWLN